MIGRHTIHTGDVLEVLRTLPDEHFHCCVTSPPYWGLRDYGVDGQIGLEPTPEAYIARMVEVFREVRRVLRSDGTCWVNIGDSYTSGGRSTRDPGQSKPHPAFTGENNATTTERADTPPGMKPKDLVGIPWTLALALRADGWYLRQDIIWAKPNPMPESVTDRCTKAHEYVFLLTKSARYFYDAEAIKEAAECDRMRGPAEHPCPDTNGNSGLSRREVQAHRNARSVWNIATQAYPEAHFATFPEELPRRCISAGTSEKGCCSKCGKPWERVVDKVDTGRTQKTADGWDTAEGGHGSVHRNGREKGKNGVPVLESRTLGWEPGCTCDAEPVSCRVLEPFCGSGTTLAVAGRLGRDAVGIELNPEYVKLAERRIGRALRPSTYVSDEPVPAPLFATEAA